MSKLLAIKGYLSEIEASQYLSQALGEPVSLGQMYELCLEGYLTVSVKFVRRAFAVRKQSASASLDGMPSSNCDEEVRVLDGVWDLAMIGSEIQEIKRRYQEESHEIYPERQFVRGLHFKRDDEVYKALNALKLAHKGAHKARLEEILFSNGYTEDELYDDSLIYEVFESLTENEIDEVLSLTAALDLDADDSVDMNENLLELETPVYQLVFRVNELNRLVDSLVNQSQSVGNEDRPLGARERNTLLCLIGALLHENGIDISVRGISASIEAITERAGVHISGDTVRKIIDQIPDAMERRSKY